jgi:hypothetical protein
MMNYGYPTDTYCPASGGAHQPVTSRGLMGVILAIVCFPVGFFW